MRENIFKCKETPDHSELRGQQFVSAVTESLVNISTESNEFLSYAEFEAFVRFKFYKKYIFI